MKNITIPIHSFSALVTNSSSEVFITADQSSCEAVKSMVNHILKAGGSSLTSDDLFSIEIDDDDKISVTSKASEENSESAQQAARALSDLENLFYYSAEFNS